MSLPEDYSTWKKELETSWKEGRITPLAQNSSSLDDIDADQFSSVLQSMPWYLNKLKSSPADESLQKEALYRYNFLKELKGLPTVRTVQEIDPSWFYELWKDQVKEKWKNAQITTLVGHVDALTNTFDTYVNDMVKEQSEFMRDVNQEEALYAYNFLRELLHRNTAQTFTAIDHQWLDQVKEAVFMEQREFKAPTSLHVYLVKKAKDLLKFRDEITLFSYGGDGQTGLLGPEKNFFALGNILDIDKQLATIYHELGHIVHKDNANDLLIAKNERTYTDSVLDPSFQSDVNKIDNYRELGRKALNKITPIGRHIADIFSRHPMLELWTAPDNPEELQKMLYLRGKEKRADLFKIEKLFEHQLLDVLLSDIASFAFGYTVTPVIAEPYHSHPSDLERALYMAGFLVDQGLDINNEFRQWYARGKCKALPTDLSDVLFSTPPKTRGACDFISVYEPYKYELWKDDLKTRMRDIGAISDADQFSSVLQSMPWYLYQLKSSPADESLQKETLYRYNFLKELKGLPTVVQEIDPSWFYEIWKDQVKEQWKNARMTTLRAHVVALTSTFDTYVNEMVKEQSEFMRDVNQQRVLYAYNFLRELKGLQPADSLKDINHQWLDEIKMKLKKPL